MKQFLTIFRFELSGYFKNKFFVGFTLAVVLLIAIGLSFPNIKGLANGDGKKEPINEDEKTKIAVVVKEGMDEASVVSVFQAAFGEDYIITSVNTDERGLTEEIKNGKYDNGFVIKSPLSYKYITDTKEITDSNTFIANEVLVQLYRLSSLASAGVSPNEAEKILAADVESEIIVTGNDQTQSFMYTYIIILLLYMSLMLYGQFVSQSVASEKSSRAMELLITSAKPINLMFGKVLGSGVAGLLQLAVLLFSSYGFYSLNKDYWQDNEIVESAFGMPIEILLYAILFFVLGFFIYAFMYGALGSLATRPEDLNTLVMPVTFIFIAAFGVVITAITEGNLDSTLMVVCSYIPLTSPMAMFARIAMSTVPTYQVVISVVILFVSEFIIGYLSAVIYKTGVLMYGNTPKIKDVFKIFKHQKQMK